MKKKNQLSDLDPGLQNQLKTHLKSKKPLFGEDSPFSVLLQGMVNQILEGEMDSFQKDEKKEGKKNKRNGSIKKQVMSSAGYLEIETPRDRLSEFEPEIIGKRSRELSSGLDQQILALYAQGNSIEDIRRLLAQMYGVAISSGKISMITDKVLPAVVAWKTRPLKRFYPILYMDAMYFKIRVDGKYVNRAFYTVYSIDWDGNRDILGLYVQGAEGASRWANVLKDLKDRGLEDVIIICVDDLNGFSEAITDAFPKAVVQKCIVHQVRNSLKYVDDKDRKKVASSLRKIYTAPSREEAAIRLDSFELEWQGKYRYIGEQWRKNWGELIAFMDFPTGMRRMVYTTNPVEAVHRIVRKLLKSKAAWVSETALMKQMFLAFQQNEKSWKRKANGWKSIQRELMEIYGDRIKESAA